MDVDSKVMAEIKALEITDPNLLKKCQQLADSIKNEKYTIIGLVHDIKSLMTSTVVDDREKGSLMLSTVIAHLPENILSTREVHIIGHFFEQRLNDHHQVVPALLKGLAPLISSENMPDDLSTQILNSIFQHVPCQQQQQPDRYNIYNIFKTLLDKRKEEMRELGLEFVIGVIAAIDGERDPRNLLFLFNWLPTFLRKINLGHLKEEMFDVISCYFPVDFTVAIQDENNVTRDNLAAALAPCLCATPTFADLCIPLALEKLESDLRVAKLDSLELLMEGCKTFSRDSFKQHIITIWPAIQREVFNCKDTGDRLLEEKCLLTLTHALKKVSSDIEFSKQLVKDMIDTLKGNLTPDAVLFVPSSKLLNSISQTSVAIAELVFRETSPLLINIFNITTIPSHKAAILEILICTAATYLSLNPRISMDDNESLKVIPSVCLSAIADVEPKVRSAGIISFSCLAKYLPPTVRNYFYQNLSTLLVLKQDPMVREPLMTSLRIFAELYYDEIQNILGAVQTNGLESLRLYLEAIGSVVSVKELTSFSISVLVENALKTLDESALAVKVLNKKLEEDELVISTHLFEKQNIIETLVDYFLRNINNFNVELHNGFLNEIAKILNTVIRNLDANAQKHTIKHELEKFRLNEDEIIIVILLGLISSLQPGLPINPDVIDHIFNITFTTESPYICNMGSQLLANVISKSDSGYLVNHLNYVESRCNNLLLINQHVENVIEVTSFVTKALVMQCSPYMHQWINKLIQLSVSYLNAAKAFKIILDDSSDYLSVRSYCERKLLYKQRFFIEITDYLVTNYTEEKIYYLTILGYLLQEVPQPILHLQLKKIIRLILLCLSYSEEEEVLHTVLSAINTLIEDKNELAEDYLQEFLKYYSKLTSFDKSMKIRILALKGIQLYTIYPLYKLLPVKQEMLTVLGKCLDDRKRLVRKEAVEARSKWFLIDGPM